MRHNLINDYLKDIRSEFKGYNRSKCLKDVLSGMTVAAVALPLALAFGVGSGATAASGMVTAILAGVIIGAFSGASFQISGPTGAMMAILFTLATKFGIEGILVAGFLSGLMLIIAGVFRLGRIIYFIPASVITGFTSGIAVIIAFGQLDHFFGVQSKGDLVVLKILSYFKDGFSPDWHTVVIGVMVIFIMVIWPKEWNMVPSSLLALIGSLLFNYIVKWDVLVVGEIPKSIFLPERLKILSIFNSNIWDYVVPALSIAALAMIESLLCGASAGKLKNERLNADRELVAQGLGNMIIPFFGGVPATAAIARTSVAIKSGCQTRLAGIIHGVFLLLSMFLLAPVMSRIPLAALSGVLIVTAWRMNDWHNIRYIFNHRFKSGMAKFFITLVATVMLDLTQAIIIGVAFSTFLIVVKLTDLKIDIAEVDRDRLEHIGITLDHKPSAEQIRVAYLTGTIFFAVVEKLTSELLRRGECQILIISMRGVPVIDLSGVQALVELTESLYERGTKVYLTSVQPKVLYDLKRGGLIELIGANHVFESADLAILKAVTQVD